MAEGSAAVETAVARTGRDAAHVERSAVGNVCFGVFVSPIWGAQKVEMGKKPGGKIEREMRERVREQSIELLT